MESSLVADIASQYRKKRESCQRIRITILDTGYDAGAQFFQAPRRYNRIIKWKDFVDGEASAVDRDGHGTHVLSLAMKFAPAADVCVARISKNKEDLQKSASNIEAVSYCSYRFWNERLTSMKGNPMGNGL